MSIIKTLRRKPEGIPIWQKSGTSVVGFVLPQEGDYEIHILNKTPRKRLVVDAPSLEQFWQEVPRIETRWLNKGSAWVPLRDIDDNSRYTRYILQRIDEGGQVTLHLPMKDGTTYTRYVQAFHLMYGYVRVWGVGENFPIAPFPYTTRKTAPPKKRKEPRTALERLLADDVIPD